MLLIELYIYIIIIMAKTTIEFIEKYFPPLSCFNILHSIVSSKPYPCVICIVLFISQSRSSVLNISKSRSNLIVDALRLAYRISHSWEKTPVIFGLKPRSTFWNGSSVFFLHGLQDDYLSSKPHVEGEQFLISLQLNVNNNSRTSLSIHIPILVMLSLLDVLSGPECNRLISSGGVMGFVEVTAGEQWSDEIRHQSHGSGTVVVRSNRSNRTVMALHVVGRLAGVVLQADVVTTAVCSGALRVRIALGRRAVGREGARAEGGRCRADLYR